MATTALLLKAGTHATQVQRVQRWLQPLVEKHNRAVMRDTIAGGAFALQFTGLMGMSALAITGIIDDVVGIGGFLFICSTVATAPISLITMHSSAFLRVDGKKCTTQVRMPPPEVIEKLVRDFPHQQEVAILHYVIQDASLIVSKIPEE